MDRTSVGISTLPILKCWVGFDVALGAVSEDLVGNDYFLIKIVEWIVQGDLLG